MTLLVGILCQDGVVMGSDGAATLGFSGMHTIGQQEVSKVWQVNPHILYSATGAVGMGQIIADALKSMWDAKELASVKSADDAMDKMGKRIMQVVLPYLQSAGAARALGSDGSMSLCKSLVAIPINYVPHLFQFDYNGAPERSTLELPFVALGSGQMIADPFLALLKRVLWSESKPTVVEGKLAAVWTIDHVRRTNPGGVGGNIRLAVLPAGEKPPKSYMCDNAEVEEHLQKVQSAEDALVTELRGTDIAGSTPQLPTLSESVVEE